MKKENQEIEFLFDKIDPVEIEKRLIKIGAEKKFDTLFESVVFDYPDFRLNNNSAWIRLRKEGDKVMLAFKKRLGVESGGDSNEYSEHSGMEEIEFEISDFQKAIDYHLAIGFVIKYHQEKRRIRYIKNGVEFDIDFWPYIDPLLEIESDSIDKIDMAILDLGLRVKDKRSVNTFFIYREAGIDLLDYEKITFADLVKRKNKIPNLQ